MLSINKLWRLVTIAALLAGALNLTLAPASPAQALSSGVVISQVYGGGGNTGAAYKNDYIELFNRGTSAVSLAGWSVQYYSATGTGTWTGKTDLTGTIQPGQYFLVQEAAGTGGTLSLPAPDATGSIAMSGSTGKVALVNNTTYLNGACPTAGIVDLVGYGTANCYETSPTAALSNTTAAKRLANGCTETDNNSADFAIADPTISPTPRNTASPLNPCSTGTSLTVNDVSQDEGNSGVTNFIFTVSLSAPAPVGGVTFDIATADGTATAGSDYAAQSLTGQTIAAGNTSYTFTVVVNVDTTSEPNETFFVNVTSVTGTGVAVGDGQGLGTIVNDDVTITSTYAIQGNGETSPLAGQAVTTTGVVVGDYEGASPALGGFYIQDVTGDGDPATSDGLYIYNGSINSVNLGDVVRVTGTVAEYQGQTQIGTVTNVTVLSTGNTITPVDISLPFASAAMEEQY